MALDISDLLGSVFEKAKSEIGLKLIAAFFVLQLLNIAAGHTYEAGGVVAFLGVLVSIVAGIAGILLLIGSFRALDEMQLEKAQFTENIIWPFLRLVGVNVVFTVFLTLAFIPALVAGALTLGFTGMGVAAGSTAIAVLTGLLGVLLGVASLGVVAYVFTALINALPEIVVNDSRLFESLDNSVQRSDDNKLRMLISLIPVALLYVVLIPVSAVSTAFGGSAVNFVLGPLVALVGALTTVVFYSTLVEFNQRLPEA